MAIAHSYNKNPERYYFVVFILILAAYAQRMGALPLFADEPTRSVVALEMILSDNYWVPTINGEFYYRKPPLYNWIIILFYKLFGSYSEGVFRIPSIFPLAFYAFFIYQFFKKRVGMQVAFIGAFSFALCGRFLVYAGLLGHIDVLYSWLTFMAFCYQIRAYEKQNWWQFFIIPYAIHGIAFLMKGLPSILFAGITPVAILLYFKHYKRLLDYRHFMAMLVFAIPGTLYFLKYLQYNSLWGWVNQLTDQSTQRTVVNNSLWESFSHLFAFPMDQFIHLAPIFFFFPLVFLRRFRLALKGNKSWTILLVILVANLPPYWLSPGYYPRYLFMLYPFVCLLCGYLYMQAKQTTYVKIVEKVFIGMAVLLGLLAIAAPIIKPELQIDYLYFKVTVLALVFGFLALAMYKLKAMRYLVLAFVLLGFRLFFNWFIVEDRLQFSSSHIWKEEAQRIGEKYKNVPLYNLKDNYINHEATFYIECIRNEVLSTEALVKPNALYIMHDSLLAKLPYKQELQIIDSMKIRDNEIYLKIVKR